MEQLKRAQGKDWQPSQFYFRRIVALAVLYRATGKKVAGEEKFSAYRANIIAYTGSYMSMATEKRVDLDAIWRNQAVSDSIVECVRSWSHDSAAIIAGAGGQNVTEWCKKAECWLQIRALKLALPREVADELLDAPLVNLDADPDIEEALRAVFACPKPTVPSPSSSHVASARPEDTASGRGETSAATASMADLLSDVVDDLMVKVPFELIDDSASAMSNEEKIAVFERLLESSMSGDGRLAIQSSRRPKSIFTLTPLWPPWPTSTMSTPPRSSGTSFESIPRGRSRWQTRF